MSFDHREALSSWVYVTDELLSDIDPKILDSFGDNAIEEATHKCRERYGLPETLLIQATIERKRTLDRLDVRDIPEGFDKAIVWKIRVEWNDPMGVSA